MVDGVLRQRLRSAGAVLIEGPKACGKTATAEQVTASHVYLDDDPAVVAALEVDPSLVLAGETPQLVDEWQLDATRVWNHVRREVDRRGAPGQFVLTGSATPADEVRRHTGAGRIARLAMRPMSLFETGESDGSMSLAALMRGERPSSPPSALTVPDVADLVVRGGWPRHLGMDVSDAAQVNVDYLANIAEVDIARVDTARRDPVRAQRLFQALARNVGMEHKVARIASAVDTGSGDLARSTVYDYLRAFTSLRVIEEQPPWSTHLRSRATLRKAARTHFIDPSLAAAALGAGPEQLMTDLNYLGLLFESLVVRDTRVYADPLDGTVFHYRDSDDLEVDIVVQTRDGAWGAFEVKLGLGRIDEAAGKVLAFAAKVDTSEVGTPAVLGVITATGYGYTRPDGVVVIPVGAFGP